MTPYGETIQEHFRHPRNYGSLDAPDIRWEDVNPLCGDRVRIEVALAADHTVSAARFQGDLCMIAKAAGSLLTEMIVNLPADRLELVAEQELIDALQAEIRPARRRCALLPLEVLRSGVKAWREGNGQVVAS
ncbi:MAG TPA: iron-sulfur cluster assembly scaffold protein [Thermoanaerobaculia bacterium]|nr:iron-sulfur cluster assembly scaffold protein [Thermoanaerobaculia bacterium]